jgi:ABC-type Fe3+-hydroxamate transport system substrate-binding protein
VRRRRGGSVRLGALAVAAQILGATAAHAADSPRRVASLNLTADEILVEILPHDRLVGVTRFADEQGTSNVVGRVPPSVTRFPKADIERLVALSPDLVVVSEYTDADFLRLLQQSGLRVHQMRGLDSMAGFRQAVLDLGQAVGERAAAQTLAARFDATLADVRQRLAGAPRPRVLYWANPHTAGKGTAIGALIECAGAVNAGAELGLSGIVPLGAERAFVADPDVVLVGTGWGTAQALRDHPLLQKLRAVKSGHIVELPTELLVTLSHHAARGCWTLAHELHPDRVPARAP